LQIPLAGTTGFGSYWSNAAEISNRGFELGLRTENIRKGSFAWTTDFNVARNVNNIEKLDNPLRYGSRDLILLQQGHSLYSFWVYKQLYVDSETGPQSPPKKCCWRLKTNAAWNLPRSHTAGLTWCVRAGPPWWALPIRTAT
jgi:hypothetical protein